MFLHFTREGFLAAGFFYRGWRSRSRELRRLQFRLSLFFAAFGLIAGFYLTAVDQWHFPVPLADFFNDLPQVLLLVLAAAWLQREAVTAAVRRPRRPREMLWAQVLPVVLPISVLALASRASAEFLHVAWIAVGFSFVCYACRLVVMERRQEATLRQLSAVEDRFYKAFRSNPAAMAISRIADGRYLDVNDRWLDSMHLRREEVIGKTSLELSIWENPADRRELVEAVRATGSFRAKAYKFRAGGRAVTYLVTAERLDVDGDPLLISMGVDLTELQSVTQQLREAQKMELVGSLAGGVAHDFNNLLTVIKGYCELIEMQGLEPEAQEEIGQIAEAADKAAALTRQLLAFSRRQVLHPRHIDLNAVVSSIEKLLRRTIGENIELATSFAPGLGTVHADPVQWEQVVINLALNARDAMPQGGQLLFETKNLDLSSPYAERNFEVPAGRYVLLSVSDTGSGIAAENLDHIFEPFFTTKEVGRGTGLGLSTVYGIVKQSGGYIWVYSEPGHGSTFKICLARVDQPAESLPPGGQRTENLYGEETILIVEDDASVRDLALKALRQYGYTAMTAGSGEEALSLARKFGGEIHLLLTDLVMPGMTGEELAQRLKRLRPAIKVVFTSGYAHLAASKKENVNFHEAFLSKPFTPSELARKVREILGPG